MQLSRIAYRAALLHLSVNPVLIRASIPSPGTLNTVSYVPQLQSARLSSVFFPQCPLSKILEQSRQTHTMSSSDAPDQKPDAGQPQKDQASTSDQLYLPSSESSGGKPQQLDVSGEGGSTVTLDHLGPMVVNVDGTLARISNWDQMTEIERKNTLRVLGKRNKQRLEALKAAEAEKA